MKNMQGLVATLTSGSSNNNNNNNNNNNDHKGGEGKWNDVSTYLNRKNKEKEILLGKVISRLGSSRRP